MMHCTKKWLSVILTSVGLSAAMVPSAQAATTWIMASGNPDNSFFTENLREFIKEVDVKSNGELKIDLRSNSTLIKLDAIKRAVQSNQVQIGEIRLGVYGNEDPMYVLDGLPGVATNYKEAALLTQAQKPYFDDLFKKSRMIAISYMPWPGQGFFSSKPLNTVADMKGLKLRIYSQPTRELGDKLGFQTTILPFAEVSQAYATGMINSLFTSAQTGIDVQIWENNKYYTYTGTMHNKNTIVVNDRAFKALSPALQQIVLDAGKNAEKRGEELSAKANQETIDVLKSHGMTVVNASDNIQQAIGAIGNDMIKAWSASATAPQKAVLTTYEQLKAQAK